MKGRTVILGGGVTGLAAGVELAKRRGPGILLVEKEPRTGGLASTLNLNGWGADIGSHRVHPNYDRRALDLIEPLLGPDLVRRPRRGRVRVAGRFVDYPPNVFSLLAGIGGTRAVRAAADYLCRPPERRGGASNFEERAESAVGRELYRLFYRPYAVKLWGTDPSRLAPDAADQRMSKLGWGRAWRDAVRFCSGQKPFYLYPKHGIGQIADALRAEFVRLGGEVRIAAEVRGVELRAGRVVRIELSSSEAIRDPGPVICTLPLRSAWSLFGSGDWDAAGLDYRALRVLYLIYPACVSTPHETYYVPDPAYRVGRISRPSAYSPELAAAKDRTLLSVEIPCSQGDAVWTAPPQTLALAAHREMLELGILPARTPEPVCAGSAAVPDLYPIHAAGWKDRLEAALRTIVDAAGIFPAGRSALFLHCNIDHCIVMGRRLAAHLDAGADAGGWLDVVRSEFYAFQVKD